MANYSLYNTEGEIRFNLVCPAQMLEANTPQGYSVLEGEYPGNEFYVLDGVPVPLMEMAPSVSGMTVSNLPIPCTAVVETSTYTVDDGVFEFSSNLPGPYIVTFSALHYKPETLVLA